MEQVKDDWNSLKDKLEIDIIEKCADNIRILTISVMGNTICNYIFYTDIHKNILC